MAITFKHAVKYNGKYYPANTPINEVTEKVEEPEKVDKAKKPAKGKKGEAE